VQPAVSPSITQPMPPINVNLNVALPPVTAGAAQATQLSAISEIQQAISQIAIQASQSMRGQAAAADHARQEELMDLNSSMHHRIGEVEKAMEDAQDRVSEGTMDGVDSAVAEANRKAAEAIEHLGSASQMLKDEAEALQARMAELIAQARAANQSVVEETSKLPREQNERNREEVEKIAEQLPQIEGETHAASHRVEESLEGARQAMTEVQEARQITASAFELERDAMKIALHSQAQLEKIEENITAEETAEDVTSVDVTAVAPAAAPAAAPALAPASSPAA